MLDQTVILINVQSCPDFQAEKTYYYYSPIIKWKSELCLNPATRFLLKPNLKSSSCTTLSHHGPNWIEIYSWINMENGPGHFQKRPTKTNWLQHQWRKGPTKLLWPTEKVSSKWGLQKRQRKPASWRTEMGRHTEEELLGSGMRLAYLLILDIIGLSSMLLKLAISHH